MNLQRPSADDATRTASRLRGVLPVSGIRTPCADGGWSHAETCKTDRRGRDAVCPGPFGTATADSDGNGAIDYSHLKIASRVRGGNGSAQAKAGHPDGAVVSAVSTETRYGLRNQVTMRLPFLAGSSGAMETAPESGNYLAIGAALSGVSVVCEEDVCGADPGLELDSHGRVETAPGMARRVERYRRYHQGSGEMIVQMNAEDVRLGVAEYAISRLGIECIEFTWGRSARCFDGEVRMDSLRQALELQRRGYLVIPDPSHPTNRAAFNAGVLTRFIRHSRLGFVDQDGFMNRVDRVRRLGARRVALRAGICSTRELALVIRWASDAELDLLTIDGAPGGAAMGPRWMTEQWGVPTLYLQSVTCDLCRQLAACGRFVPDIAVAGGFNSEDHFFKVLAMGAPYTRAICMSPGPMVPGTAGSSVGQWLDERPEGLRKITSLFGVTIEDILACHEELVAKHGRQTAGRLPLGAVALYAYSRRIGTGLRRLMADSGNATVSTITRDDVTALTPEAAQVFGLAAP